MAKLDQELKLAALRSSYTAALPERLQAMATCWGAAQHADTWGNAHAELLRLAHSLAGSAGTFGYHRLGIEAKQLEETLTWLSRHPEAPVSQQQTRIAGLFEALRSLALAGPDDARATPAEHPSDETHERTMSDNRRVVLIEDDGLLAQDLATRLSVFGWEVNVIANAVDALRVLSDLRPAAVIIDVMLPEGPLAGLELMRQAHFHENAAVPHVVISSRNDWQARLAAVRSGAAAYLVKPVDIAALDEHLQRCTNPDLKAPYRVLVVDDDAPLAGYYAETLTAAGMDAKAITEPALLLDAMAQLQPEIVLMDLHMPGCSGIEAMRVLRQDPQFTSLPVLFVSSETSVAQQQSAMQCGAEDFLQKPISDANLIMAVTVRAERFRSLTTLIRQDSLTGLLNHVSFKLRLEVEVDRCRRSHETMSLAMIDIDHFKKVNDTYGHPQGDRVIKGLAQLLQKRLRKSDIIGRYGGEEFVVAMPNTPPPLATMILNELLERFGSLLFETTQGEFACTFSGGVAAFPPLESTAGLTRAADIALYNAKHSGRNRIETFVKAD